MIAAGVELVMDEVNYQMNAVSTFPFYTLEGRSVMPPAANDMPLKGDTVIENDVWIGLNVTILLGVRFGDRAIIGANRDKPIEEINDLILCLRITIWNP